jgi:Protein of unknown function (DUF3300)/Chaperone of endosialidase
VPLRTLRLVILVTLILGPFAATAQTSTPSAAASSPQLLKPEVLDQLVAPIALYPDALLSEVLMASTYPLELVQAERWIKENKRLKDDALKAAVEKQPWDDSIKSLLATPSVLEMMSTQLDWTQKLGDAVIAQQADVMDAIQRLRAKAQANNKLKSTKEQNVKVTSDQGRQFIAIEPTNPNTLYVPYYDPAVVYGDWPYPDYPPYYWPAPGYIAAGIIGTGIAFGAGYALSRWVSGGYWGGNVNWNNNNLTINRPGGGNIRANWNRGAHVEHRLGNRGGRQHGLNFRGSNGRQVLRPGGGRAAVGERHRPGNRPSAAHRGAGNRAHAGARPSRGGAVRHRGGGAGFAHRGGGVGRGGGVRAGGGFRGGGMRAGGGFRGGGGGFRGGGRGGRRSDIRLKHDIVLLGYLNNGLGFYRFSYNGGHTAYVGVMAQDAQRVMPQAVARDQDGYLRVNYQKLGLTFETYRHWIKSGAQIPVTAQNRSHWLIDRAFTETGSAWAGEQ